MRSHSYLNTTKKIIQIYDGSAPLASWLKQFFGADKKFGSRDRKQISHACYCYYRLGGAFNEVQVEEKLFIALYLCSNTPNLILQELKPEWNETISISTDEKIRRLNGEKELEAIFPFKEELSNQIDLDGFNRSFLVQPDLYLRIRPGKKTRVLQQLEAAGIPYSANEDCIQLSNQTKIDEILVIDEDVVVQDYNSQKTIELLEEQVAPATELPVWDCCAASGGKSILLHDHYPNAHLAVSDIRESILVNLRNRFKRARITNYDSFVIDVSLPGSRILKNIGVVICDAPCSGSGTWSRTPEQLSSFTREKLDHYVDLQKRIVANAVKALKPGGYFLYITCSVFRKENEGVVEYLETSCALKSISNRYLKGYDKKADTLFTALLSTL